MDTTLKNLRATPAWALGARATVGLVVLAGLGIACSPDTDSTSDPSSGKAVFRLTSPVAGCLALEAQSDLRNVSAQFQVQALLDQQYTMGGLPLTTLSISGKLYKGAACSGTPLYIASPVTIELSQDSPNGNGVLLFTGNGSVSIDGTIEGGGVIFDYTGNLFSDGSGKVTASVTFDSTIADNFSGVVGRDHITQWSITSGTLSFSSSVPVPPVGEPDATGFIPIRFEFASGAIKSWDLDHNPGDDYNVYTMGSSFVVGPGSTEDQANDGVPPGGTITNNPGSWVRR